MLYNKERKELFIEYYTKNEDSKKVLMSRFNHIGKYEHQYGKDLCDFTLNFIDLLSLIPSKTVNSIKHLYSIINDYCYWCISQGYSKTNINPTFLVCSKDLEKYVSKIAQEYQWVLSRNKLYEMCDMLYNPRDRAALVLLFDGIKGRANKEDSFEELLNLKKEHINERDCEIEVHRNDGTVEVVKVPQKTIEYVVDAIDTDKYYEKNGNHSRGKTSCLVESDYILRMVKTKRSTLTPNRTLITNIFRVIKEHTDMPFITPLKTFQSGMLVTCAEMEKEKGRPLTTEDYDLIVVEKFRQLKSISYSLKQMYQRVKLFENE